MKSRYLVGTSMLGYGCTITVGIGIPIPILNEDILRYTTVTDSDIFAPVVDYSSDYPNCVAKNLGEVSYAELRSGKIKVQGKEVPAASLSSYPRALEIAETLRDWIKNNKFQLTEAVAPLPDAESGVSFKSLNERPIKD
jgi:L-aspartate semialdehyde sulfurtransferase